MTVSDISLVVDFLNTVDLEAHTDSLRDLPTYSAWCKQRALQPGDLNEARAVRDSLRNSISRPGSLDHRTETSLPPILTTVLTTDGVVARGTDAASAVIASATRLTTSGDWARIKICPGDDCGEAFFDHSRNRSRVWCSMALCGNVSKVRATRARHLSK